MGPGISTAGGIGLVLLGIVRGDSIMVLAGSLLISAALLADTILDVRGSNKK